MSVVSVLSREMTSGCQCDTTEQSWEEMLAISPGESALANSSTPQCTT